MNEEKPLAGRVAIVTGGGRGLGRAMTLGLANAGAAVVATASREPAEIESLSAAAPQGRILPVIADVTSEDDCARAVATALERFGRLDILVNNAGRGMKYVSEDFMTAPTRFWETTPETWRLIIDTNVVGPFLMAREAAADHARGGMGPHCQHFDEHRDHAAPRLLALRPVQGRARIRDHHLGAGPRRQRRHRQCAVAGRRDRDRHDSQKLPR